MQAIFEGFPPAHFCEAAECFSRPQDLQSLAGHFCLSTTDCKAWRRTESEASGKFTMQLLEKTRS